MRFIQEVPKSTIVNGDNVTDIVAKLWLDIQEHKADKDKNRGLTIAIDFETLGFKRYHILDDEPISMGLCWNIDSRYFVPRIYIPKFLTILDNNPDVVLAFYNFAFDGQIARNCGFKLDLLDNIEDVMLMYHILDPDDSKSLKHTCSKYLQIPMGEYKEVVGTSYPEAIVPGHPDYLRFVDYGTLDAWATYMLYIVFINDLKSEPDLLDYYQTFEVKQVAALMDMMERGIRLDVEALKSIRDEYAAQMLDSEKKMMKLAGEITDKVASTKWLGKIIYENLNYPVLSTTPSGAPATDSDAIEHLISMRDHPFLRAILEYREAQKIVSTYCDNILKLLSLRTDTVHTSYNPVGTGTGRLSASRPNLQNQPPIVRKCFIPRDGYVFLGADYSALELRIVAHFSSDENMIDVFLNDKDIHCMNAAGMNGMTYDEFIELYLSGDEWAKEQRSASKVIVYGLSYGAGAFSTAKRMSLILDKEISVQKAQAMIDGYFQGFIKVRNVLDWFVAKGKRDGYSTTICGRRRYLRDIKSASAKKRSSDQRKALNTPIQGSAADIVKSAMIKVWEDTKHGQLKWFDAHLILQIHDEFILEVREEHAEAAGLRLKEIMEHPFKDDLLVPLTCSPQIAKDWSELK